MNHGLTRAFMAMMMSALLALSPTLTYAAQAEIETLDEPVQQIQEEANPITVDQNSEDAVQTIAEEEPIHEAEPSQADQKESDGTEPKKSEAALAPQADADSIEAIVNNMSLDEKISQMIIVCSRTWDGTNVTDLSAAPQLAAALQKHQYGGFIFFGSNITGNAQIATLVQQLQDNNRNTQGVSTYIPYFVAADEEGCIVTRLSNGTRMTGNMAYGVSKTWATKSHADGSSIGGYGELGTTLFREFSLRGKQKLTASFSISNLLDKQYEVIAAYPMPGRGWRAKVTYLF